MKIMRKRYVYVCKTTGKLKGSDFMLVMEEIDTNDLKEYEILCEALYLGMDAGLRAYLNIVPPGITMIGGQVAKVIESKNPRYEKNTFVYGQFGWQTHSFINPNDKNGCKVYALPDFGHRSISLGLGVLGMSGNAAYFGITEICKPKKGETIVISSAAGGVGIHVGQLAKIHGCTVIGIAGTDEKCARLKEEFGFDHAINYKSTDFKQQLYICVPNGIDCYFDNVGGQISSKVIQKMNEFGRIAVCGAISTYNDDPYKPSTTNELTRNFIHKQLKMVGFRVWQWTDRWLEAIEYNLDLMDDGKLKSRETIIKGFDKAPFALIDMLDGKYFGKVIVQV